MLRLKQKLAHDYCVDLVPEVLPKDNKDWYEATLACDVLRAQYAAIYLAGFEKARELVWETLGEEMYSVQPKIQHLILNVGEGEVDLSVPEA